MAYLYSSVRLITYSDTFNTDRSTSASQQIVNIYQGQSRSTVNHHRKPLLLVSTASMLKAAENSTGVNWPGGPSSRSWMKTFYGRAGHCTQNSNQPREKWLKKGKETSIQNDLKKRISSDQQMTQVHTVEREVLRAELVERASDWREDRSHNNYNQKIKHLRGCWVAVSCSLATHVFLTNNRLVVQQATSHSTHLQIKQTICFVHPTKATVKGTKAFVRGTVPIIRFV